MAKKMNGVQQSAKKTRKNKGEVSELYVFLTSLKDGKIFAADENLEIIEDMFYTIEGVVRNPDGESKFEYEITGDDKSVKIYHGEMLIDSVSHENVVEDTSFVLRELNKKCIGGTLPIDTSKLETRYHLDRLSASSTTKIDIVLDIRDPLTGVTQSLPFSIKSFMGNDPALSNASGGTNIIYRIAGDISDSDIDQINSMLNSKGQTDVAGRVKAIYERGCELKYEKTQEPIFEGNLRVIDSMMPEIVAQMLLAKYRFRKSKYKDCAKYLAEENPLDYSGTNDFYTIKIKRLLMACFTGMVAETVWNDFDDVHGGYIIVKSDGNVVCNHLSNRNQFEKYLFDRAYLDTPDVGRHKFAQIERDDNGLVFKLNFFVRLKQNVIKDAPMKVKGQTLIMDY